MPRQSSSRSRALGWPPVSILLVLSIAIIYYATIVWSSGTSIHPDTLPISSLRNLHPTCSRTPTVKRVAIIGAGSAGTSTAYYLARAAAAGDLDPCTNISITIFERNSYIGGRSTTVYPYISTSDDQLGYLPSSSSYPSLYPGEHTVSKEHQQPPLELGGSVFVKVNTNLLHAATALNLSIQSAGHGRPGMSPYSLGVWDGSSFRFLSREKDSWWFELGKLFYRYGLAPLWTQRAMKDTVGRFKQMYSAPSFPWTSLTDAVSSVGLDGVTSVSGLEYLAEKGVTNAFAEDVIQASTRVNYAQNLDQIHGVETMVCMAAEGGTMSIKGGNWQIFASMAAASGAEIRLNTTIVSVSSLDSVRHGSRFELTSSKSTPDADRGKFRAQKTEIFDDIVLAAPLQFSHIDTSKLNPNLQRHLPKPIDYVRLHVTLLATKHRLAPSFFGVSSHDDIPETILTTLPTSTTIPISDNADKDRAMPSFFSISALRNLTNPTTGEVEFAYKIFSANEISENLLSALFGLNLSSPPTSLHYPQLQTQLQQQTIIEEQEGTEAKKEQTKLLQQEIPWIYRHTWYAYPYLSGREIFDGPVIGQDMGSLYYTSGIESFISTMETSSLSGRNVARLLLDSWDSDHHHHHHHHHHHQQQ